MKSPTIESGREQAATPPTESRDQMKAAYTPPQLTEYGDIVDITRNTSGPPSPDLTTSAGLT
jgi:hypothetical protein